MRFDSSRLRRDVARCARGFCTGPLAEEVPHEGLEARALVQLQIGLALSMVASILARLRTMPSSAISRAMSLAP